MEGVANPEVIYMLKTLAEDGDFESQKYLSHIYFEGEGVNKNMDESLFWANVSLSSVECDEEERFVISSRIGHILMEQRDYEGALKKFKEVYEYDKLDSERKDMINISIADVYYCLKEDCEAVKIYEYIITKDNSAITDDTRNYIYEKLSSIYMHKKEFKPAIEMLKKSIKLKAPSDGNNLNSIGFANEMLGNFDKAFKYYMLASAKNYNYAHLNLGYMHENGLYIEKNKSEAFLYYEKGKDSLEEWKISRDKFSK